MRWRSRRTWLAALAGLASVALVTTMAVTFASGAPASASDTTTATPIKHLVVIFQENASFDHYFGVYPNATNPSGEPPFTAAKGTPAVNGLSDDLLTHNPNAFNPQRLDRSEALTCDNNHGYTAEQKAVDNGKVDKYWENTSNSDPNCAQTSLVMDYYDGNTVTGLWNYAQHFAMSDNSYDTGYGPSTPGHIDLVSGNTHGATRLDGQTEAPNGTLIANPTPAWDYCGGGLGTSVQMSGQNIGDLLNAKDVPWGWFAGGFAPTSRDGNGIPTCGASHANIGGQQIGDYCNICEPFQYYASTANPAHLPPSSVASIGHTDQANHQYDLTDFWAAADDDNLPAVSFLKASGYQQGHPGISDPLDEQTFLVNTINHLEKEKSWQDTAVVIAWDDSDGWYDHVSPPIVNPSQTAQDALTGPKQCGTGTPMGGYQARCGYGPRLPLLVISPYARTNYVDHTVTDQTSILRFIEDNWLGGQRIGDSSFDALADPITGMFDFGHGAKAKRLFLDPSTGEQIHPVNPSIAPVPSYSEFPSPPPSPTFTSAPPETTPPGAFEGTDVADSYVNNASPDTNFGTNVSLRTKTDVNKSYLRFNVTGLQGTVTKATLRIYPNTSGTDLHAYSVADDAWTENGITWNYAPAFGAEIGNSAPVTAGTYVDIDVTSAVQADGDYDFGLQTTGAQLNLASRQDTAGHTPQLVIETTEPGSGPPTSGSTPPPASVEGTDVEDSYVNNASPDTNFGTNVSLRTKTDVDKSYLRFDITGIRGTVTKATLRIFANSSGTDLHAYGLASSDWTEDGITWNNAPAFGPEIGSSAPVTAGNYVDIDVTSAVQADGPHDFGLQTTGAQLNLASRQDTAGRTPQLLIDTTG